jgi:hypothetical protein
LDLETPKGSFWREADIAETFMLSVDGAENVVRGR